MQGTHIRPWYVEASGERLIFARRGIAIDSFPGALKHLEQFKPQLEPRDPIAGGTGRKPGSYKWYELQDTIGYWQVFEKRMIVWPDTTNCPRFSFLEGGSYVGMTAFIIPSADPYLLGVLASWATWFVISKTAQPLRLRSDRWQYRLKSQYMESIPIPDAPEAERKAIGELAERCGALASSRYKIETAVQHRLAQAFGSDATGNALGKLNEKGQEWWEQPFTTLGGALKTSFKLKSNPFTNPKTADEWEPYVTEKRIDVEKLRRELADAETEINDRVFRLFDLTADEIALLQREVEH